MVSLLENSSTGQEREPRRPPSTVSGPVSEQTLQQLHAAGISWSHWVDRWFPGEAWQGDSCGCPDIGCIDFFHPREEACGCLNTWIREYE